MNAIDQQKMVSRSAGRWARFARAQGACFDVERKAAEATGFGLRRAARTFGIPSKLVGTSRHQADLEHIASLEGWTRLDLHADDDTITATWHGTPLGRSQTKHYAWLLPLLATGQVSCYVLAITGGT